MSVHAVNHQQTILSARAPVTIAPSKAAPTDTGFAALFSNYNPIGTKSAAGVTGTGSATPAPFTATYELGATVTNPNGSQTALNPLELATAPTAAEVAQLLGGTVVNSTLGGNFNSSVPTREIAVPGSNNQINAGLAANLFSQYGTAQGSQAWVTIAQDLGIG